MAYFCSLVQDNSDLVTHYPLHLHHHYHHQQQQQRPNERHQTVLCIELTKTPKASSNQDVPEKMKFSEIYHNRVRTKRENIEQTPSWWPWCWQKEPQERKHGGSALHRSNSSVCVASTNWNKQKPRHHCFVDSCGERRKDRRQW